MAAFRHLHVCMAVFDDRCCTGLAVGTVTAACARQRAAACGPDAPAAAPHARLPPRAPGPTLLLDHVAVHPSPDANPAKSLRRRALTAQAAAELRHWLKGAQIPSRAQAHCGLAFAKAPTSADGPGGRCASGGATLGGGTAQPGASPLLGWLRWSTHAAGGTAVAKGPSPARWLRPSPHAVRPSRVAPVDLPSSPVTPRRQYSLPTGSAAASSAAEDQWAAAGPGRFTAEQGRHPGLSMSPMAGQQRGAQGAAGRGRSAENPGTLDLMRIARLAGAVAL